MIDQAALARPVRRLLVYRQGSLGDTLVALPALRLIRSRFPAAEIRLLTNFSISEKAAPIAALLDGTDLVHGYIRYPYGLRDPRELWRLARQIRAWHPDLLIYLNEPRGRLKAARDAIYLRACGIPHMIGVPLSADLQTPQLKADGLYEHKTDRLARLLDPLLGDCRPGEPASWDLALTAAERSRAAEALAGLGACPGVVAASIGAKVSAKDWEDHNWREFLDRCSAALPGWGLAMVGAPSEHDRTELLRSTWRGRSLNLCGGLTLRECAAALALANVYVGHDSGPMHLAAAAGTPCVAVFSARNYPGEWYPYGSRHAVFYNQVECFGCRLDDCLEFEKKCILSIRPELVARRAADIALSQQAHHLE